MTEYLFRSGSPQPFGSTYSEEGVNFSVFSENAERIELCLYDELGQNELQAIPLIKDENYCWHIFVEGLKLNAKYGFRAYGAYRPESGLRFNHNKLLVDPYARMLDREFTWSDTVFGFDKKNPAKDLSFCEQDSAASVPKSVVVSRKSTSDIEAIQARKPRVSWQDTIIYETHTRGFSQLKLDMPSKLRGTIAGLAHDSSIAYFKQLGVTAIELLPVHNFVNEQFLVDQGLSNYWGYNTLNFFSPHLSYLSSKDPEEFHTAVEKLHAAGLEIILDVVFNHTAESSQLGPTLCFRGLDNLSYYRLEQGDARRYVNDTGCGNTVRAEHPRVMQMILDSLRYWAGEVGVDGFRFDLASILGRDEHGFNSRAAFFQAISQDPLLSTCKMIAEPWDIGPGGYQLGAYPGEWTEWNDRFRDICRQFWRDDAGVLPEFARRIHGSSDLFERSCRAPRASLNFITSHDGFTLADLVSYKEKNNVANNENNRDGHHTNYSENYGAEGRTKNEKILSLRRRQQRNLIATLVLSQGTPMILGGDEIGRTQGGNNNAYCQDNKINWQLWDDLNEYQAGLRTFTSDVINLRKSHSLLRSPNYIHNPDTLEAEKKCARWIAPSGEPMSDADWHRENGNCVGWILETLNEGSGEIILMLFNASKSKVVFQLPKEQGVKSWTMALDTFPDSANCREESIGTQSSIQLEEKTLKLLIAKIETGDSE